MDFDPDFQRAHVWTHKKRIAFVEYILRDGKSSPAPPNHPGWMGDWEGLGVLVDGKQRLEAVRAFLRNDIPAFGYLLSEYEDKLDVVRTTLRFHVNTLKTRAEVLQWYLDLNTGGVVHTPEEIEKVRILLAKEQSK